MPGPVSGHQADFNFQIDTFLPEDLRVTSFTGEEALGQLFHFHLELVAEVRDLDLSGLVGKPCLLRIKGLGGERIVNGIARRLARLREGAAVTYYGVDIVPRHWLLTRRFKARIFQEHNCEDMSVPGIIRKVLADAGLADDTFRFALEQNYSPRDFVVQYRESDMDFISRLAEEEGIYFFFEHTAEGHKMVFGDSRVAHAELPSGAEWVYRDPAALVEEKEFVSRALDQQEIQIGAVCLEDFNFETPGMELRSTVKADRFTDLEYSDYPGRYPDRDAGGRYAQVRLEEFQAARRVVEMQTTVRGMLPGYLFKLTEHPSDVLNTEYLVVSVRHHATQAQSAAAENLGQQPAQHETALRCIPSGVPYRPPRLTRRPVVRGSQTALVVGPSGEEIYTDDEGYGRVKVQFHWDREGTYDENSSCWVRVSQGLAGGNYGMMHLPRVGQEVIVDFLEGDPDRPIITGRVYNGDNKPPWALPENKTQSGIRTRSSKEGEGFNELRFEDKKDEERVFLHAQKDMDVRVLNDQKELVGNDRHEIIQRDTLAKIERDEHRTIGQDQNVKVERHRSATIGQEEKIAAGSYSLKTDGDMSLVAGAKFSLEAGASIGIKGQQLVIDAPMGISLKVGGNFIDINPGGVFIKGSMVMINSGGSAQSPQMVSAVAPTVPTDPEEPITGDPGQDFVYEHEAAPYDPLENAPWQPETPPDKPVEEPHWIGIRLLDDNGEPLPGERFEIVLADGTTVVRGTLDQNGEKELKGLKLPGNCTVRFPDLDGLTWRPGAPTGAGGAGGSGGAGGGAAGSGGAGGAGGSGGAGGPGGGREGRVAVGVQGGLAARAVGVPAGPGARVALAAEAAADRVEPAALAGPAAEAVAEREALRRRPEARGRGAWGELGGRFGRRRR